MSDAAAVSLTLGQVVDLISRAKAAGANPIFVGIQIFSSLGDDVNVTGSTLTLALTTSGIKIDPLFTPLVNAIQTVARAGNHVSISLNQPIQVPAKVPVKFEKDISFDVSDVGGSPALNNIVGLAGHKLVWVNVHSIQLKQNQGRWTAAIGTAVTTINIDLT